MVTHTNEIWAFGIAGVIGVSALLWLVQKKKQQQRRALASPPPTVRPLPHIPPHVYRPGISTRDNSIYASKGLQGQKGAGDTDSYAFGLQRARPGCVRC